MYKTRFCNLTKRITSSLSLIPYNAINGVHERYTRLHFIYIYISKTGIEVSRKKSKYDIISQYICTYPYESTALQSVCMIKFTETQIRLVIRGSNTLSIVLRTHK